MNRAVVAATAQTFEDEVQDLEWTNGDLAGMAHALHLTHPAEYARVLREFLT